MPPLPYIIPRYAHHVTWRHGWPVDIYRLAGGMIVEEWAADDATAILYQVGAYTPPWLAASRPTDADGAG
jgi:hypothetical protein